MRVIIIKNVSGSNGTWDGHPINDGASYTLTNEKDRDSFASNEKTNQDIWANPAKLVINNGIKDLDNVEGDAWLKGVNTSEVIIQEEEEKTGGHYQCQGYTVNILANDTEKIFDLSFPIPVGLLSAEWINLPEFDTDELKFEVMPNTLIGVITQDVSIGATVINVSQTVIDVIEKGFQFTLTDGTNTNYCGLVLDKDEVNLTITVQTPTTNAFLAITPSLCLMTVILAPSLPLNGGSGVVTLGESKIGASYMPANTIMRVTYKNNSGTAKKFKFFLEYLY